MKLKTLKENKISFCTTCMGRLHHVVQTLPKNLNDNRYYPAVEFVLLNYNSNDNLDGWIEKNMIEHIRSGKLVYVRTKAPRYFQASHAKNMVVRFATGEIICNIDADNFTGNGFASYVNEQFNHREDIFLTGGTSGTHDLIGRVCLWKYDFLKVGGYDETITNYGFEDVDLYSRLQQIGRSECKIREASFLKTIKHDLAERLKNSKCLNELEFALVKETSEFVEAWIFRTDKTFEHLLLNLNPATWHTKDGEGLTCNDGFWIGEGQAVECSFSTGRTIALKSNDSGATYQAESGLYVRLASMEASYKYSMIKGMAVYLRNTMRKTRTNVDGFGEGEAERCFFQT